MTSPLSGSGAVSSALAEPPAAAKTRIGDMLVARGLASEDDIVQALRLQAETGGLIGQALIRLGAITEEALLATLSEQLGMPVLDGLVEALTLDAVRQAMELTGAPAAWLVDRGAVIWALPEHPQLTLAAQHPLDPALREAVDAWTLNNPGLDIAFVLAPSALIEAGLDQVRRLAGLKTDFMAEDDEGLRDDAARLRELAEEAPVIEFVNALFANALKERASDIHIEPFESSFLVRFRIDGILHLRQTQPRRRFDAIASRIKLMSAMDIGERRLPQDGRQSIRFAGHEIDMRVSALPGTWGESIVIRLLKKNAELPDLSGLGYQGEARRIFDSLLGCPNGIVLVTGPTGSGKSTTLYRGLEQINDGRRKIITIEDPVEYDVAGVSQIQVKADIGYTFARGLRAILRQDPDVILVGEIRDGETASIAAQAALTGHLVLSTLHTNSALAAISRLEDIGLERFLIAAVVRGLVAQRLARKLCEHCRSPYDGGAGEAMIEAAIKAGAPADVFGSGRAGWHKPVGCTACGGTGYSGRVAIVEIVAMDEELGEAVRTGASEDRLSLLARRQGFATMMEDGLAKARAGLTSIDEVLRIFGGGD